MADVASSTGNDAPENETPNQRQARLRREKRQAKMAEQGEGRLARIKALNGGVAPPDEVLGGPATGSKSSETADDPEEVDISQNTSGFGTPSKPPHVNAKENPLAAAMLKMQQQDAQNAQQRQAEGTGEDDPMVRMMQQVMGLMGGDPKDPNAKTPDVPPALKAMMAGGAANKEEQAPPATGSAYMWRLVHALFALILATYIALTSTFNGSKLARSQNVYTEEAGYGFGPRLFFIFCTAELLLQSTRYFAEKGQLQGSGMLATVANSGVIPEPWAGYIRVMGRYLGIAQTVFADVMVVVFVFGALAWWQGVATA